MKLSESRLPWNGVAVQVVEGFQRLLAGQLPDNDSRYLPEQITLAADLEVDRDQIADFIAQVVVFLKMELENRRRRCSRIVELKLLDADKLEAFLTCNRSAQPWIIYVSKAGGLGAYDQQGYVKRSSYGLTPCFHLKNHGVAWKQNDSGTYSMWLATARKPGKEWDWDSDIGHESCHSAFSPVPLFSLPAEQMGESARLEIDMPLAMLNSQRLASICYMCSELAVVTIRGERRETATGLPALEGDHYFDAFLALAHKLMPQFGFDQALKTFKRLGGKVDPDRDEEIFEIGAPAIRAIPMLLPEFNKFAVPTVEWFAIRELENGEPLPENLGVTGPGLARRLVGMS